MVDLAKLLNQGRKKTTARKTIEKPKRKLAKRPPARKPCCQQKPSTAAKPGQVDVLDVEANDFLLSALLVCEQEEC